ncbi:hypothetical protein [Aeromicrobium chenweiae]|nr:hypothetical protein [Aeromicrobium chenweiae]TGN33254.1 hypothetical protein E4L97_06090 [Aeromicrobium chenweiae]
MSNPDDAGAGHVPSYVHGFLPGAGEIVPVFDLARTRVPTGTELWRLRAEGEPGLKLIYDGPAHGWRRAPSYFPPLHIVGPRAMWRGLDLPAAFTPDITHVELVHVGDAAPDGFEAVRPQVSRVVIPVSECESIFEAVLTASWRGHGARVLQRAGEHALLELAGLSPDVAESVGATVVEPGVHEAVVPYSELTDVDGVTYELDPRSAGRNAEHP